ncbi:MAG TPA: hypothetical protein VKB16_23350 [Beijerinckiaceae bacterium]|jgi:hypothetical protein|nr:hypothetical protein [Beijerinckiaceae bacterium]
MYVSLKTISATAALRRLALHRDFVVRGKLAWLIAASLLFVLAVPREAHSCRVASDMRWHIFSEQPGGDYQAVAEIRITTLIRPFRYKDWRGVEEGPERAYEADAEVLRGIKGVSTGEIVRLLIPGSSCDFPFAVGVRGYISSNSVEASNGKVIIRP